MENVCENITLDLLDIHSMAAITVNQGDTARILKIYFEEQGVPYRLVDGCYAVLVGRKPDGTFLYNPCAIEKDHVIYQFTPQTASAQGEVNCEIRLYDSDDQMITSGKFQIFVMEPICIDDLVESKEEVTVLTHLVSEAATVIRDGNNLLLQGKNVLETANDVLEEAKRAKAESSQAAEAAAKEADNAMRIVGDANEVILQAKQAAANADSAAARANASSELVEDAYALARFADTKVDTLREVVSKFHNNIVCEETGEVIILSDCAEAPLQGLKVYGQTTQNGTPTPDAPVALESVGDGGSVTTTVRGKNLLNYDAWKIVPINKGAAVFENNGVTLTASGDDCYTHYQPNMSYPESAKIPVQEGDTITVSWDEASNTSGLVGVFMDGSAVKFKTADNAAAKHLTYTVPAGYTFATIRFGVAKAGTTISYKNIQVEKNSVATAFEPSKFQTLPIFTPNSLPGIPVTSGGNYTDPITKQQWICDEVDFEKGVYVQRVGKVVFDGTENWTIQNGGSFMRTTLTDAHIPGFDEVAYLYCSHFPARTRRTIVSGTEVGVCVSSATQISFYFGADYTVDMVKAFFLEQYTNGKPVILLYRTTSSVEHNLSEIDPDALAQYAALRTNHPNTTVFNDAGAHMNLKYVADTKLYVDNKFAELAAALVSST